MSRLPRSVVIDTDRQADGRYGDEVATVAVDVIRATTTAITAVTLGWRCFPVADLASAAATAERLEQPLLAGELGGNVPFGFDLDNSPAALVQRRDTWRDLVLLSSSGTRLLARQAGRTPIYAACLRNAAAQAEQLQRNHQHVALIGATSRGEFREEDQLCCARIAAALIRAGYEPLGETLEVVNRWHQAPIDAAFAASHSVQFLAATGRTADLAFIRGHVDDLQTTFVVRDGELVMVPVGD